ncbi:MAG TPA: hypothetical protein PLI09_20385 [Candidatus Hydrogenedentes bacterium]|nr:hypothetical protein [Candidatus Hydrogenedentota bacterium]
MKTPLDHIDQIAACARREAGPEVDVSAAVMQELRHKMFAQDRPLILFTAGSMITAAGAMAYSLIIIHALSNPLNVLFELTPLLGQ